MHVLIVEDDLETGEFLIRGLQEAGENSGARLYSG